ncbi:hypothetical protein EIK77_004572 [Talaromyces pinophilus]|nr:hypothetical protein EIK77_004572 [Talaromyces pinophilus]
MSEAEQITTKAISKLKADGREPGKAVTNRMLAALQTHENARRYDQAQKITTKFTDFMQDRGFSVALTDLIERPPVPTYQQVDIDQTISDNEGRPGFSFVTNENTSDKAKGHVNAIKKALNVYNNLAAACGAA